MKKQKLIKIIAVGIPMFITPLLASSCSGGGNGDKHPATIYYAWTQINTSSKTKCQVPIPPNPALKKYSITSLKGTFATHYFDPNITADKNFLTKTLKLNPTKEFNTFAEYLTYIDNGKAFKNNYSFSDITTTTNKAKYQWFNQYLKKQNIDLASKTIYSSTDLVNVTNMTLRGEDYSNQEIPESIAALTSLQMMILNNDQLTGKLPISIYNDQQLNIFRVFHNDLSGIIPYTYGYLPNITFMNFCMNKFTGPIPKSLANNLTAGSKMNATHGELKKINTLLLENNQLNDTIPTNLGTATTLTRLALFDNQLTGEIPASFDNLTNMSNVNSDFNVTDNKLTGSLSTRFKATGWPGWGTQESSLVNNYINTLRINYKEHSI